MSHLDAVEGKIEITRLQIINQLQEEIAHCQMELENLHSGRREVDRNSPQRYRNLIAQKRRLISRLTQCVFADSTGTSG